MNVTSGYMEPMAELGSPSTQERGLRRVVSVRGLLVSNEKGRIED